MMGKDVGDKLIGEQIVFECRRMREPVLIHKGGHGAQLYALYGSPTEAVITKKWRLVE
jgi:hypothetical protein